MMNFVRLSKLVWLIEKTVMGDPDIPGREVEHTTYWTGPRGYKPYLWSGPWTEKVKDAYHFKDQESAERAAFMLVTKEPETIGTVLAVQKKVPYQ